MRRGKITIFIVLGIMLLCLSVPPSGEAQSYYYQFGSYPWSVPLPVPGGYMDAANGNLHLDIPIGSTPERGHVPFFAKLSYDSHIWQKVTAQGTTSWQATNVPSLPVSWAGWRLMTSAGTGGGVANKITTSTCSERIGNMLIHEPYIVYTGFSWTAPDGHTVPFLVSTSASNDCHSAQPTANGIATDGSGYHLYLTNYTSAVVFAPNGTQIFPNVEDANGNYYSAPNSNGDVTDTLGRTPISTTVNGATTTYAVLDSQGTRFNIVVTTETIPVNTEFGQSGVTEFSGNITVVQSVSLPNGTSYQFSYDQGSTGAHYGTLTGITLPTGGTVSFAHTNFKDAFNNQNVYLTSCSAAGGTWQYSPQVITPCGTTCSQNLTVTSPSSDQQLYKFTMFNGQMWDTESDFYTGSVAPVNLLQTVTTDYNSSQPPVQPIRFTTTVPTTAGGTLKKKTEITYDTSNLGNVVNRNEWNFYPGTFPTTQDRKTSYTYLANSNNNMVNKRTSVSVFQGSNTVATTSTTTNYDEVATSSVTGIQSHDDTNFGVSYTPRGNPTSIVNSSTTKFAYDMTGQITQVTDQNGNVTKFSYADNFFDDSTGGGTPHAVSPPTNAYPTAISPPFPFSWSITSGYYWGSGKLAKTTDQNGAVSTMDYLDSIDRLTKAVAPVGWNMMSYGSSTTTEIYIGIQDTTPSTSCSSCVHTQANLDTFGRTLTSVLVSDPEGADTTTISYDTSNRVASVSNPARAVSSPTDGSDSYTYDGSGRVIKVTHSDTSYASTYYGGSVTTTVGGITAQLCAAATYGNGYPILAVDEAGKKRQTWVDGFGRMIELDEPDNSGNLTLNTCYSYDVLNNLTTVKQGTQIRTYAYDSLSRIVTATTPESGAINYFYQNGGLPCSGNPYAICLRTDARSITTTYSYDTLNRLKGIAYSDSTPAITYTYDAGTNQRGFRTGMSDGSGSTSWSYDAMGWVLAEQRTIAGVQKTISYNWNQDGSLASITYPSGRTVTYNVGNAGRPIWAKDLTNNIQYAAAASYAPVGGLNAVIYGQVSGGFGGVTETRGYNSRLEFNTISASSSAGNAQSLTFNYSLPTGNDGTLNSITNGVNAGLSESFTYDSLTRILSASTSSNSASGCWGESFGPAGPPPPGPPDDRFSNLTQINVTQCSGGTLSVTADSATNRINTTGYSHDASGNMTSEGGAVGYTYTYDGESRVTSAIGTLTGGATYCYIYDGNGFRVKKFHITSGSCAQPQNPIVDMVYWRSTSGAAIAESDGSGNIFHEYVFFGGQRIARRDSGNTVYFFYADQVGSTVGMTDANGNPCYQATFTPYGEEHPAQSTCSTSYKFTGYERDSETGLDYAFARYYNSRLGRFTSPDPLGGLVGDAQSLNRYAYVGNSPTGFTDPIGLFRYPCASTWNCDWGLGGEGGGDPFGGAFDGAGWIGQPGFWNYPNAGCSVGENGDEGSCSLGQAEWLPIWPQSAAGGGGLKGALASKLAKPGCAFLFGGSTQANAILNAMAGPFDVSPGSGYVPRSTNEATATVNLNKKGAFAATIFGFTPNGTWDGSSWEALVGAVFNNQTFDAQQTILFHEVFHVSSAPNSSIVDAGNGLFSSSLISALCGTAFPNLVGTNLEIPTEPVPISTSLEPSQ